MSKTNHFSSFDSTFKWAFFWLAATCAWESSDLYLRDICSWWHHKVPRVESFSSSLKPGLSAHGVKCCHGLFSCCPNLKFAWIPSKDDRILHSFLAIFFSFPCQFASLCYNLNEVIRVTVTDFDHRSKKPVTLKKETCMQTSLFSAKVIIMFWHYKLKLSVERIVCNLNKNWTFEKDWSDLNNILQLKIEIKIIKKSFVYTFISASIQEAFLMEALAFVCMFGFFANYYLLNSSGRRVYSKTHFSMWDIHYVGSCITRVQTSLWKLYFLVLLPREVDFDSLSVSGLMFTPCTLSSRTHTDTKWGPWALM